MLPFTLAWLGLVTWKQVQRMQWAATDDRGLPQRMVLARRHRCAGGEDSDGDLHRIAVRPPRGDGGVRVDTAGGRALAPIRIPYLARETAGALHERLAQAAQTAFRW